MILDRDLQLEMLNKMASVYPFPYDFGDELDKMNDDERGVFGANLYYLKEHEFVSPQSIKISLDNIYTLGPTKLTAKGADFIADDGGLSAILGVVTVRFEAEQLRQILEVKIRLSDLDPERKQSMISALRELPAESIKHLTTKILDMGWDSLPTLMVLIQTFISSQL